MEHYAPKYNPERWKKYELIRTNNNCYNYANQKITNSFAQPGYASGHAITDITPAEAIKACESDGLVKMDVDPSAPVPEAPPQPNCLIALMVQEGREQTLICWAPKTIDILGKSPDQSYWNTTFLIHRLIS